MENDKYKEILQLIDYWVKISPTGTPLVAERIYDGLQLVFPNGADVVQHAGSYGSDMGCVEFAGLPIDDLNYCAIPLEKAKEIIETFFDELNETY